MMKNFKKLIKIKFKNYLIKWLYYHYKYVYIGIYGVY